MNTHRHTTQRLSAALGAAVLTAAATLGLGIASPVAAAGVHSAGGGGGAGRGGGFNSSDDNGEHLGEIRNGGGGAPGDSGLHTGDPN